MPIPRQNSQIYNKSNHPTKKRYEKVMKEKIQTINKHVRLFDLTRNKRNASNSLSPCSSGLQ